jgi:flagellar basal-body rod modification protein FlgD
VTGKVSSVRLASGTNEAVAVVDGKPVAVGRITEIATTPAQSTTPAS